MKFHMKLKDLFAAKLIIFVNKDLLFMLPYSAPSMIKFSGKHPQLDSSCSNAHCPLIISIIYVQCTSTTPLSSTTAECRCLMFADLPQWEQVSRAEVL